MGQTTESIHEMASRESSSNKRTQPPDVVGVNKGIPDLPTLSPPPEHLTFVRQKGHYNLARQVKFKNSLLAGVGFLELANAGDFAVNVWNQVPAPTYAIALMALGGTLALGVCYFAFNDARLSLRNVRRLREERCYLRKQKMQYTHDRQIVHSLDALLDVNFRETGTELVDHIGMDILMGFGA
jgi:hypothetical protein